VSGGEEGPRCVIDTTFYGSEYHARGALARNMKVVGRRELLLLPCGYWGVPPHWRGVLMALNCQKPTLLQSSPSFIWQHKHDTPLEATPIDAHECLCTLHVLLPRRFVVVAIQPPDDCLVPFPPNEG
jgi:hypothetical protein